MAIAEVAVSVPIYPYDKVFDYLVPKEIEGSLKEGHWVKVPFGKRQISGIVFKIKANSEKKLKLKEILEIKINTPVLDKERIDFCHWLAKKYFYPLGQSADVMLPSYVSKASPNILKKEIAASSSVNFPLPNETSLELNPEQKAAFEGINKEKTHKINMLWGITGSGKTEVYLRLIKEKINEGKSCLVLVPEISLTPQLVERFEKIFPKRLFAFHSSLKNTLLRKNWMSCIHNKGVIALGARSALFSPIENLGLIIADEEHDASYKQDERLRYHAIDSAIELAHLKDIPIVLGSATPRIESYALSQNKELCEVYKLHSRAVADAQLPKIEIINLRKQIAKENKDLIDYSENKKIVELGSKDENFFLSPKLLEELRACIDRKEQAILFLNRRGFSSHLSCLSCGESLHCPNCDVALTLHYNNAAICHYCSYTINNIEFCPTCPQESPLVSFGIGTQKIEHLLQKHFEDLNIFRMDQDTINKTADLEELIEKFKSSHPAVLIGTQMVAKGHDFPKVSLVGIILADMGLQVPDFRAYEKTLQLLLQVSGRAGRADIAGKVLVQSFEHDNVVLQNLKEYTGLDSYESFLKTEIAKREALSYPPASNLSMLRIDGNDLRNVKDASKAIAQALNRLSESEIQILGPNPAPISRLKNKHRWQLLVKCPDENKLQIAGHWIMNKWQENKLDKKYRCRLSIDSNPYHML